MNELGWCEAEHYGEAMQDLKLYGMSEQQFDNLQQDMILQDEHITSRDKQIPFRFYIGWLEKWIISSCVHQDEYWTRLDKFDSTRTTKHNSLEDLFSACLAQVEETFNNQLEFKIYEKGNKPEDAVAGYVKNLNHYLAVMEFT
jgi:hypothetical protein